MKPVLYWIPGPWLGRLAIVARPKGGDWLSDEASGWHQARLDIVVSLLEDDEAAQLGLSDEAEAARARRAFASSLSQYQIAAFRVQRPRPDP